MAEREPESVIINDDYSGTYSWVIALGIILLISVLFFSVSEINLFGTVGTESLTAETPGAN